MNILFWGIGNMGLKIVNRLADAGHTLHAWDINKKNFNLLNKDIIQCQSKDEDTGVVYDAIISILPDDDACRDLAYNTEHLKKNVIWINLSTISVKLNDELTNFFSNGEKYISSPVMGRMDMAEKGLLDVYYGGKIETFNDLKEIYKVFSKKVWFCGEHHNSGLICKLAGNFLLNSAIESISEATSLAIKNNISENLFSEIMLSDVFDCPAYHLYFNLIKNRSFTPPGFRIRLGLKDINLICSAAEASYTTMPVAYLVKDRFIESIASGNEDLDESAISLCSFKHSGILK
ncbi:hypothetical protein SAMN05216516_105157 [Izhakiella capsodis]|uniref:3-hydroxyisobutyrate dehydrogenase n=1 Tax=Izhakiella capsodis TaxID=1367852 RepID=A0A1I4Y3K6_9GAMM|nr:NAD(P)-dependent oxidoreductase [Izhakiella capsodis]SFN32099.1 hypothetical protein SAMN05216516_105157 [Izhakiella capsodis]